MGSDFLKGRAGFSRCGRYRYWLRRHWDSKLPQCAFIGLNPSTANAQVDDPTLRRCIGFARQWGYGSLLLVNLFSLRTTNPRELSSASDPVGSLTNTWLRRARRESQMMVVAWGNGGLLLNRANDVNYMIGTAQCLGFTVLGMPRHPLYCAKRSFLVPFQTEYNASNHCTATYPRHCQYHYQSAEIIGPAHQDFANQRLLQSTKRMT